LSHVGRRNRTPPPHGARDCVCASKRVVRFKSAAAPRHLRTCRRRLRAAEACAGSRLIENLSVVTGAAAVAVRSRQMCSVVAAGRSRRCTRLGSWGRARVVGAGAGTKRSEPKGGVERKCRAMTAAAEGRPKSCRSAPPAPGEDLFGDQGCFYLRYQLLAAQLAVPNSARWAAATAAAVARAAGVERLSRPRRSALGACSRPVPNFWASQLLRSR